MQKQVTDSQPGQSQTAPNESALDNEPYPVRVQSYASLGLRVSAYIIDVSLSVLSVTVPVYLMLRLLEATGAWVPTQRSPDWDGWRYVISIAFFLSTGPLYFVLCHASPWQATVGKRLLKVYVARSDGSRISLGRSFIRSLTLWVLNASGLVFVNLPVLPGVWALACISLNVGSVLHSRKGVHDFIAGTVVLRGRPVPGGKLEPWRIAAFVGFPVAWMLLTFLATA